MTDRRWESALVGLLLLLHGSLVVHASRMNFVTVDEASQFAAGVHEWKTGDHGVLRVNPPLVRMIAVLPVMIFGAEPVPVAPEHQPWDRLEADAGRAYADVLGRSYHDRLRLARWSGPLWSIACGLLLYLWARALYGRRGAALTLVLWCFEPTVLGHAALMTNDVAAATACLGGTYLFWRLLPRSGWRSAALLGATLGVALLVKYTCVLLVPIWLVLWALRRQGLAREQREPLRRIAPRAALAVVLAGLVVNLGYGFQGSFQRLDSYRFVSATLKGDHIVEPQWARVGPTSAPSWGNRFIGTVVGALPVPLPEDFVRGLDQQRRDLEGRWKSYLHGEWRRTGWWHYYLQAAAIKLPLGTLALVFASLVLLIRRIRRPADRTADLSVLFPSIIVLAVVSSETGLNHHFRYVLPALPFLLLGCARLGPYLDRRRPWALGLIVIAVAASIVSTLRVYPRTLSYFNELVGGPAHGDDHLLDSNIDWGQDALELMRWIEAHPEAMPVQLAYFGGVDPHRTLGLEYDLPYLADPARDQHPERNPIRPGTIAASVNLIRGLGFVIPTGSGGWRQVYSEDLAYLRELEPIATVGYSIRVFRLTQADADRLWERLRRSE